VNEVGRVTREALGLQADEPDTRGRSRLAAVSPSFIQRRFSRRVRRAVLELMYARFGVDNVEFCCIAKEIVTALLARRISTHSRKAGTNKRDMKYISLNLSKTQSLKAR
jgi:hypothetical protein